MRAIDSAAIEQHLRENGKIVGGREQARVPGYAAHKAGSRIVHDAPEHRSAGAMLVLRGGNARAERCGGREQSVLHAQRPEDVLRAVDVQRSRRKRGAQFPPRSQN